jgi:hypothetical protein
MAAKSRLHSRAALIEATGSSDAQPHEAPSGVPSSTQSRERRLNNTYTVYRQLLSAKDLISWHLSAMSRGLWCTPTCPSAKWIVALRQA